jgi:hypothetical protein
VRLPLSALLTAWLCAAQEKGAISGTVVSALTGAPLNKVTITAESTSVTSDAEGHFILADLPPGQYQLKGTRNGYLETTGKPITLEADGDSGEAERISRRESERHSGMNPNTIGA